MQVELVKIFRVEAAHRVPGGGKGAGLHGHSFRIEVVVSGEVDEERGWLVDFADIKRAVKPLLDQLDHSCLNDVEGLADPTTEGLAAWLKDRVARVLPGLRDVRVRIDGDNAFAPVELPADPAEGLPARIRFSFEAAQSLPHLPVGHPCRRLHGHTYRVEVGARDLERLRRHLQAVYDAVDHRYLNEVPGLTAATSEHLCRWLWERLAERVGDLTVVVVQETATSRCIHYGR